MTGSPAGVAVVTGATRGLGRATALGRVGQPEEIAEAIVALVSSELRWVTAERIEVSGGSLL